MQDFSDPYLKWSAKLLRLTLDLEHEITQTRVDQDTELLRPAFNAGLFMSASEVFILLWIWGPRFSLKRDLRVEVRFASDDLSLVIFGQLTAMSNFKSWLQVQNVLESASIHYLFAKILKRVLLTL